LKDNVEEAKKAMNNVKELDPNDEQAIEFFKSLNAPKQPKPKAPKPKQ
jgi:hypothetical protein